LHEPDVPQRPQVRAGVLERRGRLFGALLGGLLALGQEIEQLRAPQRPADPGELGVEGVLELPVRHRLS
jgi:hypothetical protein